MNGRHLQDFGEKLGGARKDLASRLRPRDEVGFAEEWPEQDYAGLIATGMPVLGARALKEMRAQAIGWVEALRGDEARIQRHAALVERLCAAATAALCAFRGEVTASVLSEVCTSLRSRVADANSAGPRSRLHFLDWTDSVWRGRIERFTEELERGWPRPAKQWTLRFAASGTARNAGIGPDGEWFVRVREQRWQFATEDAALQKASDLYPDLSFQEPPEFIRLTQVERVGLPDFRSQRDVEPQDFLDVFRFRGVEFGNWTSQAERGEHLNRAWDALMDISAALGLAPSALSLEGRLGLAFGARGHGGRNAARAHYEPSYRAINLTRNWGAGSLAHEWWHACDHYLYDVAIGGPSQKPYLSAITRFPASRVSSLGFEKLMPQLRRVSLTKAEWSRETEEEIELTRAATVQHIERIAPPIADEELSSIHRRLVETALGFAANPEAPKGSLDSAVAELRSFWRAVSDEREPGLREVLNGGLKTLGRLTMDFVKLRSHGSELVERKSQFLTCAEQLDLRRTKAYWSTPWELAARAFAAFVEDRLAELGGKNEYLVHSTNCRHPDFRGFAVYPVRTHRAQVAEAFNHVFACIREDVLPGRHRPALAAGEPFTMETHRPRREISLDVGPAWNAAQMPLF